MYDEYLGMQPPLKTLSVWGGGEMFNTHLKECIYDKKRDKSTVTVLTVQDRTTLEVAFSAVFNLNRSEKERMRAETLSACISLLRKCTI
jgi:hypothetical protein